MLPVAEPIRTCQLCTQAVMAGSSTKGLRSHPLPHHQQLFQLDEEDEEEEGEEGENASSSSSSTSSASECSGEEEGSLHRSRSRRRRRRGRRQRDGDGAEGGRGQGGGNEEEGEEGGGADGGGAGREARQAKRSSSRSARHIRRLRAALWMMQNELSSALNALKVGVLQLGDRVRVAVHGNEWPKSTGKKSGSCGPSVIDAQAGSRALLLSFASGQVEVS